MRKIFIFLFIAYLATAAYFLLYAKANQLPKVDEHGFIIWLSELVQKPTDKVTHVLLFFPMVPLAWLAFCPRRFSGIVLVLSLGIIFGFITETVQYFLPYRAADFGDLLADVMGSLVGMPFALLVRVAYPSSFRKGYSSFNERRYR